MTLWSDLLAPSPASGWAHEERASLGERGPADLVLALAIVHHLALVGNVPLQRIARWLGSIGRNVVVEVPHTDDPMVRQLVAHRPEPVAHYGVDQFRAAALRDFEVLEELQLSGIPRTMFLLKRRLP